MKELTVQFSGKKSSSEELEYFQKTNDTPLPNNFLEFFKEYEGCRVKENTFQDRFTISRFLNLNSERNASVTKIYNTYIEEEGVKHWLPFATDPGGWVFCMSLAEDTYGQIFVDRFGLGEENPFEFVAPSLEVFINGLEAEE